MSSLEEKNDTIQALEADNNRLKGQVKMKEELIPGMEKMIAHLHKVQEENKKWKCWASEVIYWSHSASKDILGEKKLITADNKPTMADVRDFGKEITKLKEQNKKLAELQSFITQQEQEIEELKSNLDYDPEEAEIVSKDYIKELKEENQKLKKEVELLY